MSSHRVEVCHIDEVKPHPNADRLDLVRVKGWHCVTQKNTFKAGDQCIYIPIDSVLPQDVEEKLFPKDAKVKLSNHRVKTIKLRGAISQGMAVKPEELVFQKAPFKEGTDYASQLGITKYEPPKKVLAEVNARDRRRMRRGNSPHFRKYTDLENIKNYPTVFTEGEHVVVTEKIHGTNFRAGWVPFVPHTLWHKIRGWFGANPQWEFVYGSRNLQLQLRRNKGRTYYADNVYWEAVEKYNLREKIGKGVVVYGEIYGPDIQKGYHYGLKPGERNLVLFDVMDTDSPVGYCSHDLASDYLAVVGLPMVPVLYSGPYNEEKIKALAKGRSVLSEDQAVREGVVVRPKVERTDYYGRAVLKAINDDYLLSKHADEEVAHDQVA